VGAPAPRFSTSRDGTRIAYDVSGAGPAVILLHGLDHSRQIWHERGYVERVADEFTVIAVDLRGHGDSDKPIEPESYRIDLLQDDILCVADAIGASTFSLWGYSYGGVVGSHVPANSDRVTSAVMMGIAWGTPGSNYYRRHVEHARNKWAPAIDAYRAGTLDLAAMTDTDRARWQNQDIPLTIARACALLEWPPVHPADVRCPVLWLVGTANDVAMLAVKQYEAVLSESQVTLHLVPGFNHWDELIRVDDVVGPMREFTARRTRATAT
jgi:pimeloyl-ACP methyl ester carboxylesterase